MRRIVLAFVALAFFACLATTVLAATWTKVGTSGFATTTGWLQDLQRIKFNSITLDAAGNIYATAVNGNNTTSNEGVHQPGGLTIFKPRPGGGYDQIDVDLDALGFFGGVTKLVTGGDGAVYGLQNWLEIDWSYSHGVNRIIKISDSGAVSEIWQCYKQYSNPPEEPNTVNDGNRIGGMTVGGDGNIYWTTNGANSYWKYHMLWRYDVASGTVEESPTSGVNYGWSETHRMFDLEWVGGDNFCILGYTGSSSYRADFMSWTSGRTTAGANATSNPGWGCDWVTATAYDALRKKLWVGGRGGGSGPWKWFPESGSAAIVDLGEGNYGIRVSKIPGKQTYWRLEFPGDAAVVTMASRFRVDAYDPDYDGTLLQTRPAQVGGVNKTTLHVKIKHDDVNGDSYYVDIGGAAPGNELVVLGPVVLGEFNEVYMSYDGNTDNAEVWWNGVKKYDGTAVGFVYYNYDTSNFGPGTRDSGAAGACTAVFDWVGVAPDRVAPGDPWPSALAYYLSGSPLPEAYGSSNIMSRWNGDLDEKSLFDFWTGSVRIANPSDVWHTNANDPNTTGKRNGDIYWVSALAINPVDGNAWMGYGAGRMYDIDEIGTVWADDLTPGTPVRRSEGVPETGAQVVGLTFANGKAYALTCNMATGAYSVYEADAPPMGPTPIAAMKAANVGTLVETDTAKIVTYGMYGDIFAYIEDDNRAGGIKVVPALDQPLPTLGERAQITGLTCVKDGEAYIHATSVSVSPTEDTIKPLCVSVRDIGGFTTGIQPATIAYDWTKLDVPGATYWVWPPHGLNTTGLLVTSVGKIVGSNPGDCFYLDDGSGYPIKVMESTSYWQDGTTVSVTGVSSLWWDMAHGLRQILTRDESDVVIQRP